MLTSLPNEVVANVLSQLGTLEGLSRASQVSKSLHELVHKDDDLPVWREIAERKYGVEVAKHSSSLYNGAWAKILRDDNRKGALLSVTPSKMWRSMYRRNKDGYYFCCLVPAIEYDRIRQTLLVHIDARGEDDLRHPNTNHLMLRSADGRFATLEVHKSLMYTETRGHYKGVLEFDLPANFPILSMIFYFANSVHWADYYPISFGLDDRSIETNFRNMEGFRYSKRGEGGISLENPFGDDTAEKELERWLRHVPERIVTRRNPRWWV